MVEFEEVVDTPMSKHTPRYGGGRASANKVVEVEEEVVSKEAELPSQQRFLDADAIEKLSESIFDRPSARVHLQVLATRLRREGEALKRDEASRKDLAQEDAPVATANSDKQPSDTAKQQPSQVSTASVSAAAALTSKYTSIDKFTFDMGGYNSEFVTLYISLPSVGSIPKSQISCKFQETFFDLIVEDLNGKSYRLFKDNLEHDIDPKISKYIVKADKVIVKLGKQKKEYGGYDMWSNLTAKKPKNMGSGGKSPKDDPASSIMDLMKDLYDSGDDNMKKMIGETMMKQRRGELDKPDFKDPKFDDL
jgi:calcyclin binding protein